jgi:hypothetical protein
MKFSAALFHMDSQTLGSLLLNTGLGMEVIKLEGVVFKDYLVGRLAGVHRGSLNISSKLPTQV